MININHLKAGYLLSQLWSAIVHVKLFTVNWYIHIPFLFPLVIAFLIFLLCLVVLRKIWNIKTLLQQESIFLELTPPAFTEKTAYTTQQLFSVLHNVGSQRTIFEKLLGKKVIFSFEIVSTRETGIRYLVRTTADQAQIIELSIIYYLPQVRVKRVTEYLPETLPDSKVKIIEFKLKKHFAFPLAKQNVLQQHDPVAYITGMMTKLAPGELIALQVVISPTKTNEAHILSHKILRNEDILHYLNQFRSPWYLEPFFFLIKTLVMLLQVTAKEIGWVITEVFHGSSKQQIAAYQNALYQNQQIANRLKPARVLSSFEQEAVTAIQEKVNQSLFSTSLRVCVLVNTKHEQKERIRGIQSSFAPFTVPMYQSLRATYNVFPFIVDHIRLFTYKNRLLSFVSNKSSMLLAVSEIADLYHFPFTQVTQTENIVKILSRELPAPLSLKNGKKLDVVFGKNAYGNNITDIGMTDAERAKHVYLLGQTGSGKSTIVFHMAKDDIQKGRGVGVLDPHGDLAKDLLYCIPEKRLDDIIYFNPFDLGNPVCINLLELPEGLSGDELELEKELVCESVVSLFRRVFSQEEHTNAHRIEYILRNTIHTVFTLEERTIFTVYRLLTDPKYRKLVTSNLEDEDLQNFWKNEFGIAGNWQVLKMIQGVTTKIGRFLRSPTAKRILEQEKSTINFDDILNQGKILICNLSEGKLGEDTSQLLGTTIISKIQQAAVRRERMEAEKRKPFYLFVDEFQNFATHSFTKMLSGGRKFGLRITIAEQSTSQQEERRTVNIILANTGTVICFRTASPLDEELMLVQFSPYIQREDIVNLPNFRFYIKVSATIPEEPFSGETLPIIIKRDAKKLARVIAASRKNWTIVYTKSTQETKKIITNKGSTSEREKETPKPNVTVSAGLPRKNNPTKNVPASGDKKE